MVYYVRVKRRERGRGAWVDLGRIKKEADGGRREWTVMDEERGEVWN